MKKLILIMLCLISCSVAGCALQENEEVQENTVSEIEIVQPLDDDVYLSVILNESNGKPSFSIETNLPSDTIFILTLSDDDEYLAQDKVIVSNGKAVSQNFSSLGDSLEGQYTLQITSPIASVMEESVQDIVGTNGELMTGDFIHIFENSGQKELRLHMTLPLHLRQDK